MLVCGEKAPNRADRMPSPRAARWPDPSRSASLPVGNRTSPSSANVLRSDCVTVTYARTAMSPTPVADPSTKRDVPSWGLAAVPPKKCCAVVPPNGMIRASLVPRSEADTIGTTTPMSTLSSSPKLTKNDVTVMSRSSARRSAITSFSWVGTPYGVQLEPTRLSHAGPVTFSCVKVISMPLRLTPRSASKCMRFTFAPTNTRPRPRVWPRSAKTGPGETDVRTGTPPSKRKVGDVAADGVADEGNERAVLGPRRRDEMVGVQGRGRVRARGAAEEQRVLAGRKDEELGDLVAQALRLERRGRERESHQARPAAPHKPPLGSGKRTSRRRRDAARWQSSSDRVNFQP